MAKIYIAFVDTPGLFADLIRFFQKQKYVHVVLSMDRGMEEAYSFGRRNPFIPVIAGFEQENKELIACAFPTAEYRICEMECSEEQRKNILEELHRDYRRRFQLHYAVIGLPFVVLGRKFYIKNQYTCSSYVARVLEKNGLPIAQKHFSLVTPKDVYQYADRNLKVVFEGRLSELIGLRRQGRRMGRATAYE